MYTDHLRRKGVFRWHYEVGDEPYTFLKNEKKKKKTRPTLSHADGA